MIKFCRKWYLELMMLFSFMVGTSIGMMFNTRVVYKEVPLITPLSFRPIAIVEETEVKAEESAIPQPINRDFDIFKPSGYTKVDFEKMLSKGNYRYMLPFVDTLLQAEEEFGVNAFYLMCKLGYESGWTQYTSGKNNIAGWTNGKGGWKDFASKEECILYVAEALSTRYKSQVGGRLEDVCELYNGRDTYIQELMKIMRQRAAIVD